MSEYQINSGVTKELYDYYRGLAVQADVPISTIGRAVYSLYCHPKYATIILQKAIELHAAKKGFQQQQIDKDRVDTLEKQNAHLQQQMNDLRKQLGLD